MKKPYRIYFKGDNEKVNFIFSFAPSPPFLDEIMKNKGVELITMLFLSCKTFFEKFLFWFYPLNLETMERKGKKLAKYSISQEQKKLFRRNQNHFLIFEMLLIKYIKK